MSERERPVITDPTPGPDWSPTHRAPEHGLAAWSGPSADETAPALDGGLEVQLLEQQGDWAHVLCSNGWATWVDGRELEELGPPTASLPPDLLAALEQSVEACGHDVEEFAAGQIDAAELQRRMVREGMVHYGDSVWLLELEGGSWYRYDGLELRDMSSVIGAAIGSG